MADDSSRSGTVMRWVFYAIAACAILSGINALHKPYTPLVSVLAVLSIVLGFVVVIGTWAITRRR
jgi:hypothetical protein